MDKNQETFETWNKMASLYEEKFMDLDLYNESYDFFCNSIKKQNARILDVGCGPGNISRYILAKHPDFRIEGIDISANMVELAKKNNPNAHFSVKDIRNITQLNKNFDGIICGFCLPFLSEEESKKLISDSFNLLTEDGILYISFMEGDPAQSDFKSNNFGDRVYFYYHNLDSFNSLLFKERFEEPKIFRVNYSKTAEISEIHTIVITKKKQS